MAGRATWIVVATLVVLAACAALVVSMLRYDTVRIWADASAVDRKSDLTPDRWAEAVLHLRVLAAALLAGAIGVVVARRTVERFSVALLASASAETRRALSVTRSVLVAREERLHLAVAAALFVGAAVLRAVYLDLPLRYDEATTFNNYASKPLYVGLANYETPNNHVLHTVLVHAATSVLGDAPWALRAPAFVAGILLVLAVYLLGRRVYGRSTALVALALAATSSTLVEYSTNARGYTLLALLTVALVMVGSTILERESMARYALLAVLSALAVYAVPVGVYAVGGVVLWIAVEASLSAGRLRIPSRLVWAVGGGVALTLALYAPILAASGPAALTANEFVAPRGVASFFSELPSGSKAVWRSWTRDLPQGVAPLLVALALAGTTLAGRLGRHRTSPLVAVAAFSVVLVVAQRVVPPPRVWLFALPLVLVVAAAPVGWILDRLGRRAGTVAAIAVAGGSAVALSGAVLAADSIRTSRETGALLDAPAVARTLSSMARPGDAVVATGSDAILEYYLRRHGIEPTKLLYAHGRAHRLFLVVNTLGGQTRTDLIAHAGLGAESSVRLIRRFPTAEVYLATR